MVQFVLDLQSVFTENPVKTNLEICTCFWMEITWVQINVLYIRYVLNLIWGLKGK